MQRLLKRRLAGSRLRRWLWWAGGAILAFMLSDTVFRAMAGRPLLRAWSGTVWARPGGRALMGVGIAAALVLVAMPSTGTATGPLSYRQRRAMVRSRVWIYGLAALICTGVVAGATFWVGGEAAISLESEEAAMELSTASGPVDIVISPSTGQVVITNDSPLALLVLAYGRPQGAIVTRRFARLPASASEAFGLMQGVGEPGCGIALAYVPALVPADWLYPMVRDWGLMPSLVVLAALQFVVGAGMLCGADLAMARFRK